MVPADERAALRDPIVVLPFANLRTATGERKRTGLANSLQPGDPVRATPQGRVVEGPPGAGEGAGGRAAPRGARARRKAPAAFPRRGPPAGRSVGLPAQPPGPVRAVGAPRSRRRSAPRP